MRDRKSDAERPWKPSDWLVRFYSGIKHKGSVLDVACGAGRHFSLGLSRAKRLTGVDRDISQAAQYANAHYANVEGLTLIEADLEDGRPFPFRGQHFDGVIVTNYLWRPILADIVGAVAVDGVLIYETFGIGQETFGKPSNPDFLLRPGELLDAVTGRLRIVAYEHARLAGPERIVQRIAAVGPGHPWPGSQPPWA